MNLHVRKTYFHLEGMQYPHGIAGCEVTFLEFSASAKELNGPFHFPAGVDEPRP